MRSQHGIAPFTLMTLALVWGLLAVPVASAAPARRARPHHGSRRPSSSGRARDCESDVRRCEHVTTFTDTNGVYVLPRFRGPLSPHG